MADQLYLSLWFPNFRLESLPVALARVLLQAYPEGTSPKTARVHAAAAFPLSWNESPVYQRVYFDEETEASTIAPAVAAATEALHDDYAYEFEVKWPLWLAEVGGGLEPVWREQPRTLRVIGFGPDFDEGAYEQNGHIRIDFGTDTPFLQDDVDLDPVSAGKVKENVKRLVDFTTRIEKHCGISSRLLWSESGESLAQKLIDRLQKVN